MLRGCWHCLLFVEHQQHAQCCLIRAGVPARLLWSDEYIGDSWECAKGFVWFIDQPGPFPWDGAGQWLQEPLELPCEQRLLIRNDFSSYGKRRRALLLKLPKTKKGSLSVPPQCQLALLAYFLFWVDPLESLLSELTSSSWRLSGEAITQQVGPVTLDWSNC